VPTTGLRVIVNHLAKISIVIVLKLYLSYVASMVVHCALAGCLLDAVRKRGYSGRTAWIAQYSHFCSPWRFSGLALWFWFTNTGREHIVEHSYVLYRPKRICFESYLSVWSFFDLEVDHAAEIDYLFTLSVSVAPDSHKTWISLILWRQNFPVKFYSLTQAS